MRIVNDEGENIGIGRSIVRNCCAASMPCGSDPYGLGAILVASRTPSSAWATALRAASDPAQG
jgi:hypothetical protein